MPRKFLDPLQHAHYCTSTVCCVWESPAKWLGRGTSTVPSLTTQKVRVIGIHPHSLLSTRKGWGNVKWNCTVIPEGADSTYSCCTSSQNIWDTSRKVAYLHNVQSLNITAHEDTWTGGQGEGGGDGGDFPGQPVSPRDAVHESKRGIVDVSLIVEGSMEGDEVFWKQWTVVVVCKWVTVYTFWC